MPRAVRRTDGRLRGEAVICNIVADFRLVGGSERQALRGDHIQSDAFGEGDGSDRHALRGKGHIEDIEIGGLGEIAEIVISAATTPGTFGAAIDVSML